MKVLFSNEEVMDVTLEKDLYIIGRQEDADIHIDNLGVSRHHARLRRDGSVYAVEDLDSANGTFVNGKQVSRHNLNDGDEVTIGKYTLIYSGASAEPRMDTMDVAHGAARGVTDSSLNTMAMDGDAIRKRIEEMRGDDTIEQDKSAADTGASRFAELRARDAEIEMLQKNLTTMKLLLGVFGVAVLGLLVYLVLRG
jgi:pSer/pThr/pTyr-binding forkhead associated (FHA) protein